MRAQVWFVIAALAGCGDDGGARRDEPDAAVEADAAVDGPGADAAVDAPVDADGGMLQTAGMFDSTLGMLCGLGFDAMTAELYVYPCRNTQVHVYSEAGVLDRTVPWSGEIADDADIDIADATYTLGTTDIAPGDLVMINGETGPVDIYASPGEGTLTLATEFGDSHVVGGSHHPVRGSFFLLQDRAAASAANTVGEIDLVSGALVQSFSTGNFDVSYGDLDVCNSSGELYVVSSVESTLAVFSPVGARLGEYMLPAGLTSSGLALTGNGEAWLSTTSGSLVNVTGLPCQ